MRVLFEVQDKMEDELKTICRKEEIDNVDLENIYKIVDIIKDVTTIDAMHKSDYSDYSRGWDTDYSYARGRDSRGRYMTSRDDMPRTSNRNEMIDHLTDMMRSARTEEERENYRKTIDQLSR